jgi:hypothetical protein
MRWKPRGRQRKHDMEVTDRQQVSLTLGKPCPCSRTLALGAVPVAAAVIGDPPMPAIFAGFNMAAKRRSAAGLNRRHHLELDKAQMSGVRGPVCGSGSAEDVGDLK